MTIVSSNSSEEIVANYPVAGSAFVVNATPVREEGAPFVDRRNPNRNASASERRQFGSSHTELTSAGRELAVAIDQYKLERRRRYITCDELLTVLSGLGYAKQEDVERDTLARTETI